MENPEKTGHSERLAELYNLLTEVYRLNGEGVFTLPDEHYRLITAIADALHRAESVSIEIRWLIRSDDDGHDYLIPASKDEEFDNWREWSDEYWSPRRDFSQELADWQGTPFDDYRIEGQQLTFTNPQLGGENWKPE